MVSLGDGKYVEFARMKPYLRSMEEVRNKRLGLNRMSVQADLSRVRLEHTRLSTIMTFNQFSGAEYFLYMSTVCHEPDVQQPFKTWIPSTALFLKQIPSYLGRALRRGGLEDLSRACGFDTPSAFVEAYKKYHGTFIRFFPYAFKGDIVTDSFIDNLGSLT